MAFPALASAAKAAPVQDHANPESQNGTDYFSIHRCFSFRLNFFSLWIL